MAIFYYLQTARLYTIKSKSKIFELRRRKKKLSNLRKRLLLGMPVYGGWIRFKNEHTILFTFESKVHRRVGNADETGSSAMASVYPHGSKDQIAQQKFPILTPRGFFTTPSPPTILRFHIHPPLCPFLYFFKPSNIDILFRISSFIFILQHFLDFIYLRSSIFFSLHGCLVISFSWLYAHAYHVVYCPITL